MNKLQKNDEKGGYKMTLPKQLQNYGFRFVLAKGKRPEPKDWNGKNNLSHDNISIKFKFESGFNIFVCTGFGGLLVVDYDAPEAIEKVYSELPNTFTVKTGSGGLHSYYIVDDCSSAQVNDSNGSRLIDLQGINKGVLAPNSIHPVTKHKYVVVNDAPIVHLKRSLLDGCIERHFPVVSKKKKTGAGTKYPNTSHIAKISEVLTMLGIPIRNPTLSPFVENKGNGSFSYNDEDNVWYDHHLQIGGGLKQLLERLLKNA